jgi:hypothetical protein
MQAIKFVLKGFRKGRKATLEAARQRISDEQTLEALVVAASARINVPENAEPAVVEMRRHHLTSKKLLEHLTPGDWDILGLDVGLRAAIRAEMVEPMQPVQVKAVPDENLERYLQCEQPVGETNCIFIGFFVSRRQSVRAICSSCASYS